MNQLPNFEYGIDKKYFIFPFLNIFLLNLCTVSNANTNLIHFLFGESAGNRFTCMWMHQCAVRLLSPSKWSIISFWQQSKSQIKNRHVWAFTRHTSVYVCVCYCIASGRKNGVRRNEKGEKGKQINCVSSWANKIDVFEWDHEKTEKLIRILTWLCKHIECLHRQPLGDRKAKLIFLFTRYRKKYIFN